MSRYQSHVFGPLEDQHLRLISVLRSEAEFARSNGIEPEASRLSGAANKLEDCCRTPHVMIHEVDRSIELMEFRCKQRTCMRCSRTRSAKLTASLLPLVEQMNSPRLITLTPLSNDEPLRDQLIRLTKCFANLRRTKLWKMHFSAGFWTLEMTHNPKTDQWHPHIHMVVDGRYCKQRNLSAKWLKITGDSKVVDLRMCYSKDAAIRYVIKYVNKTGDVSEIPNHRIADWVLGIRGLRLVNTFGGLTRPPKEETDTTRFDNFSTLTPMSVIDDAIARGVPGAQEIWEGIIRHAARSEPDDGTDAWSKREAQRIDLIDAIEELMDPGRDPPEQTPDAPQPNASLFPMAPTMGS